MEHFSEDEAARADRVNTDEQELGTRIKVIGVGGAGSNAVDRLRLEDPGLVELAAVNTDRQSLDGSPAPEKLLIGRGITNGLSAGDPEVGREAAAASSDAIQRMTDGYDLIFILCGLGRGTGSGAAQVIADIASQRSGALVITFATLPFSWEGERRLKIADEAVVALRQASDAVITLPNDQLLQQATDEMQVLEAFALADEWISRGVEAICSMILKTGLINQDVSSLRRAFVDRGGKTLFAVGSAEGERCVDEAIQALRLCPLLHRPDVARRADSLIVNIIGGTDLKMNQVHQIMKRLTDDFGGRKSATLGAVIDEGKQGSLEIVMIGTTDVSSRAYCPLPRPAAHRSAQAQSSPRPQEAKAKEMASEEVQGELDPDARWKPEPAKQKLGPKPVHESKLAGRRARPEDQEEFTFFQEEEQRGYFDHTERNLYDGEDLDVPTFLRQNIKVVL